MRAPTALTSPFSSHIPLRVSLVLHVLESTVSLISFHRILHTLNEQKYIVRLKEACYPGGRSGFSGRGFVPPNNVLWDFPISILISLSRQSEKDPSILFLLSVRSVMLRCLFRRLLFLHHFMSPLGTTIVTRWDTHGYGACAVFRLARLSLKTFFSLGSFRI